MNIRIKGVLHDDTIIEKIIDGYYIFTQDNTNLKWNTYDIPDLGAESETVLDTIEKIDYTLASQTKPTEFLWRVYKTILKEGHTTVKRIRYGRFIMKILTIITLMGLKVWYEKEKIKVVQYK